MMENSKKHRSSISNTGDLVYFDRDEINRIYIELKNFVAGHSTNGNGTVIITHGGIAHEDETFATAVLIYAIEELMDGIVSMIVRSNNVSISSVPENAIVIDTGGVLKPPRFIDHHSDLGIPSTFSIILQIISPAIYDRFFAHDWVLSREDPLRILDLYEVRLMDLTDRFGFHRAVSGFGIDTRSVNILRSMGFVGRSLVRAFSKVDAIHQHSELFSVLRFIGGSIIEHLVKELRDNKLAMLSVANSSLFDIAGYKVMVNSSGIDVSPSKIRDIDPSIHIVIMRNDRNDRHTSIVRLYDDVDLSPIVKMYKEKLVFMHRSGFLAVIDVPVERVLVDLLSRYRTIPKNQTLH